MAAPKYNAITRIAKYKKSDVIGVAIEATRTKEKHEAGLELPNTFNDWDVDNYFLKDLEEKTAWQGIKKKLAANGVELRNKTSVAGVGVMSQAPSGFFDDKSQEEVVDYFKQVEDEIVSMWCQGDRDRLVYSVIHLDEKEPHLQLMFVPLYQDERGIKLSAKDVIGGPAGLRKVQDRLYKDLYAPRGWARGQLTSEQAKSERKKHQTTQEWRRAQKEISQEELQELDVQVKEAKRELGALKIQKQALATEYNEQAELIEDVGRSLRELAKTLKKPKKTLFKDQTPQQVEDAIEGLSKAYKTLIAQASAQDKALKHMEELINSIDSRIDSRAHEIIEHNNEVLRRQYEENKALKEELLAGKRNLENAFHNLDNLVDGAIKGYKDRVEDFIEAYGLYGHYKEEVLEDFELNRY